eukprot:545777-Pelagomonas_calceolata.AAC.1
MRGVGDFNNFDILSAAAYLTAEARHAWNPYRRLTNVWILQGYVHDCEGRPSVQEPRCNACCSGLRPSRSCAINLNKTHPVPCAIILILRDHGVSGGTIVPCTGLV